MSSYVCDEIIRFLLSEHPDAVLLRSFFVFYIIPMVNVDGVVNGLSVTDISGHNHSSSWNFTASDDSYVFKAFHDECAQFISEKRVAAYFKLSSNNLKQGTFLRCASHHEDSEKKVDSTAFSTLKLYPENVALSLHNRSSIFNINECNYQKASNEKTFTAKSIINCPIWTICTSPFPPHITENTQFSLESDSFTRYILRFQVNHDRIVNIFCYQFILQIW
jgi:hypothetical protein